MYVMHLVPPGPLRPLFADHLCSRVVEFAAACPGHSGEERHGAVNQPPAGGELAPVVGKDAGRPSQYIWVCWEHLSESPVRRRFNAHLQGNFNYVQRLGDVKSEWAMFCVSIVEADRCCGRKQVVPVVVATPTPTHGHQR